MMAFGGMKDENEWLTACLWCSESEALKCIPIAGFLRNVGGILNGKSHFIAVLAPFFTLACRRTSACFFHNLWQSRRWALVKRYQRALKTLGVYIFCDKFMNLNFLPFTSNSTEHNRAIAISVVCCNQSFSWSAAMVWVALCTKWKIVCCYRCIERSLS